MGYRKSLDQRFDLLDKKKTMNVLTHSLLYHSQRKIHKVRMRHLSEAETD